jgi:MFS transporter, FHS family, L-fucose permease
MFPTIFSLSILGLGHNAKQGASLVIMSIVVIMGNVSDLTNIQTAYSVPTVWFLFIIYFAFKNISVKKSKAGGKPLIFS